MPRALSFYQSSSAFGLRNSAQKLASRRSGSAVNLSISQQSGRRGRLSGWGRVIFQVSSVDAIYEKVLGLGLVPDFAPRNASWGERYFHIGASATRQYFASESIISPYGSLSGREVVPAFLGAENDELS